MDGHLQSDHYKPSILPSLSSHGPAESPQMASRVFNLIETKEQSNKFFQIFSRSSKVGGGAYETVKTWRSLIGWVKDRLIGELRDL